MLRTVVPCSDSEEEARINEQLHSATLESTKDEVCDSDPENERQERLSSLFVPPPAGPLAPLPVASKGGGKQRKYTLEERFLSPVEQARLTRAGEFFTQDICVDRVGPKLQPETWKKRREYFLGFQGFLFHVEKQRAESLGLDTVLDIDAAQRYLQWLGTLRGLDAATRRMHSVGLAVVLQYVTAMAKKNPKQLGDVRLDQAANAYRQMGEQLGAEKASSSRPVTREVLVEQKKWLDWDKVLEVVDKVAFAVAHPRKTWSPVEIARKHMALLALRFYTQLPPGRSKEFWTLTFGMADGSSTLVKRFIKSHTSPSSNSDHGVQWIVRLSPENHKKNVCNDIPFSLATTPDLFRQLETYLSKWRPILLSECKKDTYVPSSDEDGSDARDQQRKVMVVQQASDSGHVFLNHKCAPFSNSASWFGFLSRVFETHTGMKVGPSMLRSSLITSVRDSEAGPLVRESIARGMSHSVQMADRVYNRRTAESKLNRGVEFMAQLKKPRLATDDSEVLTIDVAHQMNEESRTRFEVKEDLAVIIAPALLDLANGSERKSCNCTALVGECVVAGMLRSDQVCVVKVVSVNTDQHLVTVILLVLVYDNNVFKVPLTKADLVPCAAIIGPLDSDRIERGEHKGLIRVWTSPGDIFQALQK